MTQRTSPFWVRVGAFVLLVTVAFWPSTSVRRAVSEVCCALFAPLLSQTTFGGQTHIEVQPLQQPSDAASSNSGPGQNIAADTALILKLTQYAGQMQVQLSLRRDIYLPLVVFIALMVVSPLTWRRRAALAFTGSIIILTVGAASVYVLLANIYSGRFPLAPQLSSVYPVSGIWGDILQFLHERWLTPPANRIIAPLMLGALMLAFHWEKVRNVLLAPGASRQRLPPVVSAVSHDKPAA